MIEEIKWQNC